MKLTQIFVVKRNEYKNFSVVASQVYFFFFSFLLLDFLVMQLYALANVVGDYCWYVIRSRFTFSPVFSFQWMCLRTRIIMIFAQVFSIIFYVACFVAVFFFFFSFVVFFSLHSYVEGRKILFLYFFVFSFDHNSQKTPTHLMMYQYSDSNLEETSSLFSFFREFTFGSFYFTFFVIDVCVILWENIEEIH